MRLLDGRRAVVIGAASGIGLAAARRLAQYGARVACLDLDAAGARAAAAEVGGAGFAADVADAAQVEATIAAAADALGGLEILVNAAGAGALRSLHRYSPQQAERLVAVNLMGVLHALRAALPRLVAGGGGVVVNVLSATAERPTPGEAPYAAAKAGALALTRSAALEYGPAVRVNAVSPGLIRTPMSEALFRVPGLLEPALAALPLRRAGTPDEVADVILFLACDLSAYVTGQNLVVDGGLTLPQAGIDAALRDLLARLEPARAH
jgi:NAD(P)-dependent dehydrogenase (short-subunit alcohol dehydrogenase family)